MNDINNKSGKLHFSKNVRLTSNENDIDPDFLMRVRRINKINHHHYNPTLDNKEWSKHFKEILYK
jgi:hypothetical protein